MGGGGALSAMVQSIKENNALRKSRRDKFKSKRGLYTTGNEEKLEFKKVNPEELQKINAKNLKRIEKEEQNRFLKFIGIVAVIGIAVYFLFR